MPRMIPEIVSSDTESNAEKKVFTLLQKVFDDSWTIFHSFSMQGVNTEGKHIDAEADFVLFNKFFGILILEIKGGIVSFEGNGKCFQNGIEIRDPEYQARANKYNLKRILNARLHGDPQIRYAHAVYFSDTFVNNLKLPPAYEQIAFTGKDTPYIDKCIKTLMQKRKCSRKQELSDGLANAIITALAPKVSLGNTIFDRIEKNRNTYNVLTEIQTQLLKFISRYKHALIEGFAGSGKTVLAIKKARQLALDGNKVLLLCYNKMLAEHLKESVKDLKEFIDAGTYHDFCLHCLKNSKFIDRINLDDKNLWDKVIPDLMSHYLAENPLNYDAVIIDEAQDFKEDYWFTLLEQVQDNKYFYLFYDPSQNIFSTKMSFPEKTVPFTLNRICRNTSAIFEYMQKYTESDLELFDDMPPGKPVVEFSFQDSKEQIKFLGNTLKELIHEKEISPENIVVLGAHSFEHTILKENSKFGDIVVIASSDDDIDLNSQKKSNEKHINYYTYMKFKGCEADMVILLDVDESDPRWNNNGMYTAASRAKTLLYVIKNNLYTVK